MIKNNTVPAFLSHDNHHAIKEFIKKHEGFRLKPYKDSIGKWTVFYGRNIDDVPCSAEETRAILDAPTFHRKFQRETAALYAAELFLKNDIENSIEGLYLIFSNFDDFTNNRKMALTSVMYNLGFPRFKLFKKMIDAIINEEWDVAHDELLDSLRGRQLKNRSKTEAVLLRDG